MSSDGIGANLPGPVPVAKHLFMTLSEPRLTDHSNTFPELCSGIPTRRRWLFLETHWEQDAREEVCREAPAPSCRMGLKARSAAAGCVVFVVAFSRGRTRSEGYSSASLKTKQPALSLGPKTNKNSWVMRHKRCAEMANSDLWVQSRTALPSPVRVAGTKREEGATAACNGCVLLTRIHRFPKRNLYQDV